MPDKKLDRVLEGYKPIPMKRLYYPRGMKLSESFINAFHREFDRLVDEGVNPRNLLQRFGKAMHFHVNEERKYHLLDEIALPSDVARSEHAKRRNDRIKMLIKRGHSQESAEEAADRYLATGKTSVQAEGKKKPDLPKVPEVGSGKPWATRKGDVEHQEKLTAAQKRGKKDKDTKSTAHKRKHK